MKRSKHKTAAWVIAAFASLGIAHAEEGSIEILSPTQAQLKIIQTLLDHGVFRAMDQENWYEIDQERLQEMMEQRYYSDEAAHEAVELLRRICGKDVDIREVHIIEARMSTQDFSVVK